MNHVVDEWKFVHTTTPPGWTSPWPRVRFWPVSGRHGWRSRPAARLHLGLLCDLQRIVNLDAEIPDGAFELCMSKQKLNNPKIPGSTVDQRGFGAPHGMSAAGRRVEPNRPHPRPNDPRILPGRQMGRIRHPAGKQELIRFQVHLSDPGRDRVPRSNDDAARAGIAQPVTTAPIRFLNLRPFDHLFMLADAADP